MVFECIYCIYKLADKKTKQKQSLSIWSEHIDLFTFYFSYFHAAFWKYISFL